MVVVKVCDSPPPSVANGSPARQWMVDGVVTPKELLIDVRTRWNSTHDMIERALELREPLDSFATAPTRS